MRLMRRVAPGFDGVVGGRGAMARRRIGQEDLIARPAPRTASSLTEIAGLLD
jgi:hypothetical protein